MTSEEFYGHTMALLSGSHATEVATKILKVATSDKDAAKMLNKTSDSMISELVHLAKGLTAVQLYIHTNSIIGNRRARGETLQDKFIRDEKLFIHRDVFLDGIRESLKQVLRVSTDGPEIAADIGLDIKNG